MGSLSKETTKIPQSARVEQVNTCQSFFRGTSTQRRSVSKTRSKSPTPLKKASWKCDPVSRDKKHKPKRSQAYPKENVQPPFKDQTFCTSINNTQTLFQCRDNERVRLKDLSQRVLQRTEQLSKLESKIRSQEQSLRVSQIKVRSFQGIYVSKMKEILEGRKQVEVMAKKVQEKLVAVETQTANLRQKDKLLDLKKQQLQSSRRKLEKDLEQLGNNQDKLARFQNELKMAVRQLEEKNVAASKEWLNIQQVKMNQFVKDIQLKSKETYLVSYVSQLDNCIGNLKVERTNMSSISTDLSRRCEQLQGIQIKMFNHLCQKSRGVDNNSRAKWITIDSFKQSLVDIQSSKG